MPPRDSSVSQSRNKRKRNEDDNKNNQGSLINWFKGFLKSDELSEYEENDCDMDSESEDDKEGVVLVSSDDENDEEEEKSDTTSAGWSSVDTELNPSVFTGESLLSREANQCDSILSFLNYSSQMK